MYAKFAALAALVASATAQQVCTLTAETHPSMSWSTCTGNGSCTSKTAAVTIDANWRWTHSTSAATNCYDGNTWNKAICDSDTTCATKCCVDGSDYSSTYGITTSGNALNLKFVTKGSYSTNIGSRTYLMASDTAYQTFQLLGNEFTFDVDVSNIGCGLNGALYFVSMDADGGLAKYPNNKAGAKYGTGYCDAQCPRDLKYINGEANIDGWVSSSNDANAGTGNYGSCCSEMDIWEANKMAAAFTPHPCTEIGQTRCQGDGCGGTYSSDRYSGVCDPDGCDFNSYRQGDTGFYGPGGKVNTNSKFTVVTQFLKDAAGDLAEIKRFYVQDGKIIPNSQSTIPGVAGNSITQDWCSKQKSVFGDTDDFNKKGGLKQMGKALAAPMVLVMSIWDDHSVNMLWLDSTFPTDSTALGSARGACATTTGVPTDVESQVPNSNVIYSNIRFGAINSTVAGLANAGGSTPPVSASSSSASTAKASSSSTVKAASSSTTLKTTTTSTSVKATSTSAAATAIPTVTTGVDHWGQCGGIGYSGATVCKSPYVCTVSNPYYSQCL